MILAILEQIFLFLPLLLGAYLSMGLMKVSNLSIESAYLFGAIIASQLLLDGFTGLPALAIALLGAAIGGAIAGLVAGLFAEKAQFSHVLSAIITVGLFQGIAQLAMNGCHITLSQVYNPLKFFSFSSQYPQLVTISFISMGVFFLFVLFMKTQLGISCAIYGSNHDFLQNYRINKSYVVISGLVISNALAGISGYMVAQNNGFVDLYMGMGLPLLCISSLIIGKSIRRSFKPIQPSVPLLGCAGYFIIQFLLLKTGFDLRYFIAVQAMLVAIILLLSSKFLKESSRQDLLGI